MRPRESLQVRGTYEETKTFYDSSWERDDGLGIQQDEKSNCIRWMSVWFA